MKYQIVSHTDAKETENEVNVLLEDGWHLHGDLKATDQSYIQALVKYGDYESGSNDVSVYMPNQENLEDAIKSIGDALETGLATVAQALAHKE